MQIENRQQWGRLVSEAHGFAQPERVPAAGPAEDARRDGDQNAGPVRQGPGPGVHRGVRDRVLAAWVFQVEALEKYQG